MIRPDRKRCRAHRFAWSEPSALLICRAPSARRNLQPCAGV